MKTAIIQFPGSNCDQDCLHVFGEVLGTDASYLWHRDNQIEGFDLVVLPGGFSYGDYLRAGAIARLSPIMQAVRKFAQRGGYVLGICNGFQILLENHLLPGAMLRNQSLQFICRDVTLKVAQHDSPFLSHLPVGSLLQIPIAHAEGNYTIDSDGLKSLQDNDQIAFYYSDLDGVVSEQSNPNGSLANIAGITNQSKNVLGMMPHPERAAETVLGSTDGMRLLQGLLNAISH